MSRISHRMTEAFEMHRKIHASGKLQGSGAPYLSHTMAVAALVLEFGGTENQAIAGLLHDSIENGGTVHRGEILSSFGEEVLGYVDVCTDAPREAKSTATTREEKRAEWRRRKLSYLAHMEYAPLAALFVSACDKLHNARSIVRDLEDPNVGEAVFLRFTSSRLETLAYYQGLLDVFAKRELPMVRQLDQAVTRMHELVGVSERVPLHLFVASQEQ